MSTRAIVSLHVLHAGLADVCPYMYICKSTTWGLFVNQIRSFAVTTNLQTIMRTVVLV